MSTTLYIAETSYRKQGSQPTVIRLHPSCLEPPVQPGLSEIGRQAPITSSPWEPEWSPVPPANPQIPGSIALPGPGSLDRAARFVVLVVRFLDLLVGIRRRSD